MAPSANEIMKLLDLEPHSTCGFTNETYRSALEIPASALPAAYAGSRSLGGVLYFLVTPEAPIRLHRIRSDQMYHHYLGEPLEVLLVYPNGKSEIRVVGPDLNAGMRPQLMVPGGTFHAGRVRTGGGYALLGTSVWLRAEPADVEMGDANSLSELYPAARDTIAKFTSPDPSHG
jgi:predicted cupin superfamily sugar epimerase